MPVKYVQTSTVFITFHYFLVVINTYSLCKTNDSKHIESLQIYKS